ncbi:hypothetical protein HDR63_03765 [bacterium]|nr:hypothetical protein [bacterium]
MKKQVQKNTPARGARVACCSRRQKIWGIVALVGLFGCGFMIGYAMRPGTTPMPQDAGDAAIKPACQVVEEVLLEQIFPEDHGYGNNFYNADIYSRLVENGCPENAEKFKAMALRQIEIGTGLLNRDDDVVLVNVPNAIDAYKKMDMQREAQKFLDKVQKLTNPAIEFIMQMQAIINE